MVVVRNQAAVEQAQAGSNGNPWRWHATAQSAEAGQLSILALLETIGAMAVYALIAIEFGTLHLTVAACIAPLLLLRTPRSTTRAVDNLGKCTQKAIDWSISRITKESNLVLDWLTLTGIAAYVMVIALGVKVFETIVTILRHPLDGLQAIPLNWNRLCIATDSTVPPEPLPGAISAIESGFVPSSPDVSDVLRPIDLIWSVTKDRSPRSIALLSFLFLPYVICLVAPSIAYRWSIKGTALVLLPVLWVAKSTYTSSLWSRLDSIRYEALGCMITVYSAVVLAFLATKISAISAWQMLSEKWQGTQAAELLDAFLVPDAIPPWHLAAGINAALALLAFFLADQVLRKRKRWKEGDDTAPNEARLNGLFRSMFFVRAVLTCYTISISIYTAASLVKEWDLPKIGTKLFPWS